MPASKRKNGRPSRWDEETALVVGFALGRGLPLDEVARAAGISASTLRRYLSAGELGDDRRFQRLAQLVIECDRSGPMFDQS